MEFKSRILLARTNPRHTIFYTITGPKSPASLQLESNQPLARHRRWSSRRDHTISAPCQPRSLHTQRVKILSPNVIPSTTSFLPRITRNNYSMANVEASKKLAAYKAVEDYIKPSCKYVGIGSGSTVVYVVDAIKAKGKDVTDKMIFVPTGDQSKQLIIDAGLPLGSIDALPLTQSSGLKAKREELDVAFDGADEVDDELNLIKGGGACLFQEKLVAIAAKKFVVVADYRKLQPRLLTGWKAVPIEISPLAAPSVIRKLITLGSLEPKIRQGGSAKAGPVVTDNGMWIIDAPFPPLSLASDLKGADKGDGKNGTWEVYNLGKTLIEVPGILEVGLFYGRNGIQVAAAGEEGGGQKPVAAYFGMADGTVEVRVAKELPIH